MLPEVMMGRSGVNVEPHHYSSIIMNSEYKNRILTVQLSKTTSLNRFCQGTSLTRLVQSLPSAYVIYSCEIELRIDLTTT